MIFFLCLSCILPGQYSKFRKYGKLGHWGMGWGSEKKRMFCHIGMLFIESEVQAICALCKVEVAIGCSVIAICAEGWINTTTSS